MTGSPGLIRAADRTTCTEQDGRAMINRVALLLGESAGDDPVTMLGPMLLLSQRRPWRPACPGLTGAETAIDADRLIITGVVGGVAVRCALRPEGERLGIELTWTNTGDVELTDLVLGLTVSAPAGARVTMPQVIQHDNPSADPARTVPHVGRGGFVTQLHRLPIPAVCVERSGEAIILATDPTQVDINASLGVIADHRQTMIIVASGALLFDGRPDVDYVHKAVVADNPRGYLSLRPGAVHEQRLILERTRRTPPGLGFRRLVEFAEQIFVPVAEAVNEAPALSRAAAITGKTAALDARWYADGAVAGYLKFPAWGEPRNRPGRPDHDFLYGWTGQCLRLAWCDARLAARSGDRHRLHRSRQVTDFYLAGSATTVRGLRWNHYLHDDRRWAGFSRGGAPMISSRAHGETLVDLIDLVTEFDEQGEPVPDSWVEAIVDGADFVCRTVVGSDVVPLGWRPDGSAVENTGVGGAARRVGAAGIPAAQAVVGAYRLTGDRRFLDAARRLTDGYLRLPGPSFERPYALSTLDAACEDKESGLAMLRLLMALQAADGDDQLLERAGFVADWLLTWVYHWSPVFDVGSMLAEAGFRSYGWPGVSVQNHHLDVFFPTHDLWRLGMLTGNERYRRWAVVIDAALRQGICTRPGEWGFDVVGEQAEAFFVTDWQQRGAANTWNPSWVIALPLWNALLLEADRVDDPVATR